MPQDPIPSEFAFLAGHGPTLTVDDLKNLVVKDLGLSPQEKTGLLNFLNNPNAYEHLLAGGLGASLALVISKYYKMKPVSQALMSLAGFGVGNIILNALTPAPKHTSWNAERATNTIRL
jgi:hypothetical protein